MPKSQKEEEEVLLQRPARPLVALGQVTHTNLDGWYGESGDGKTPLPPPICQDTFEWSHSPEGDNVQSRG